jgi:hypothetical protein
MRGGHGPSRTAEPREEEEEEDIYVLVVIRFLGYYLYRIYSTDRVPFLGNPTAVLTVRKG